MGMVNFQAGYESQLAYYSTVGRLDILSADRFIAECWLTEAQSTIEWCVGFALMHDLTLEVRVPIEWLAPVTKLRIMLSLVKGKWTGPMEVKKSIDACEARLELLIQFYENRETFMGFLAKNSEMYHGEHNK